VTFLGDAFEDSIKFYWSIGLSALRLVGTFYYYEPPIPEFGFIPLD